VHRHTAAVTTGTLEEMHWEMLPYPVYSPDLVKSDFHLFGSLKESPGGKRIKADDEVKLSVKRWLNEQPQTFLERRVMKVPQEWRRFIKTRREYVGK